MSGDIEDINVDSLSDEELSSKFSEDADSIDESQIESETDDNLEEGLPEDDGLSQEDEPSNSEDDPDEGEENIKAKYEELAKKHERLMSTIGQQGNQIGELRRKEAEYQQLIARMNQGNDSDILDEFTRDPRKVLQEEMQRREDIRRKEILESQIGNDRISMENRAFFSEKAPELESNLDSIKEVLRSDGVPEDGINNFISNPYVHDRGLLLNLYKRASAEREANKWKERYERVAKKNPEYLKKIDKALDPRTNIRGKKSSPSKLEIDPAKISGMSDKDLEEALKQSNL